MDRDRASPPAVEGRLYALSALEATGLPVHLSGNFEAHGGTREVPSEVGSSSGGSVARWNRAVAVNVIEAYVALLLHLREVYSAEPSSVYTAWPFSERMSPTTASLLQASYATNLGKRLAEEPIFLQGNKFVNCSQGIFRSEELKGPVQRFVANQFPLFSLPPAVYEDLSDLGVGNITRFTQAPLPEPCLPYQALPQRLTLTNPCLLHPDQAT